MARIPRHTKYHGPEAFTKKWQSCSSTPGKRVVTVEGLLAERSPAAADEFRTHQPNTSGPRFTAIPDHQFVERAPLTLHIKGVLPKAELVVLYGPSGSGKSFFAFDMAASIATGTPWRGRRTTKGRAVYVAAEGSTGFLNRLKAYTKIHRADDVRLK